MLPVLDNSAMREADRYTIEDLGMPGLVLMENAATGVVDAIRETFPDATEMLVLCGPGNNGGDGLAMARHLYNGGIEVSTLLFADPERLSSDAAANFRFAEAFGLTVEVIKDDDLSAFRKKLTKVHRPKALIVDALLGTGLARPLSGRFAAVAEAITTSNLPVVAVDVPTGLNGSSASVPGPAIAADLTVTFAALKTCHALPPACELCGEIVVVDISIPLSALESGADLWLVEDEDVALMLPQRPVSGHKGTFGHLGIVAGGRGRGGAAAMACRGAVAAGAGLVTAAVPAPVLPVVDGACLEAMVFELPADENGDVSDPGDLIELTSRFTAIAAGPGLGTGRGARETMAALLENFSGPLLLDADGLNMLAAETFTLADREEPTILTPHPGELARLLTRTTAEIVEDRLAAARECAASQNSVVVAKGYRTIIAEPGGQAWLIPTGDQHLATGGSGDVLTGLIGGLLTQGVEATRAAIVGAWLHGRAGEIGGEQWPAAVPASELPSYIARAWSELVAELAP